MASSLLLANRYCSKVVFVWLYRVVATDASRAYTHTESAIGSLVAVGGVYRQIDLDLDQLESRHRAII